MKVLLILCITALAVTACGRVGPIKPPGPAGEIIYPRKYPSY